MTHRAVKTWASRLLLPLLLVNVTVANQLWMVGPVMVSQLLLFWPAILCAFLIVLLRAGVDAVWPYLLLAALLLARLLGANDSSGLAYFSYSVPLHGLFLIAGAIVAVENRELLLRQLRIYLVLSVPMMFLQVAGAGDWTLALNTETTAVGDQDISAARISRPMMFVPHSEDMALTIGQSRPAGFMHANNVLSFVIMVALALQFGRIRSPRVSWSDMVFVAAMVLAMAKIVMLSFVLMAGWLLVFGARIVRKRIRRVIVLSAALYALYAFLFPGLFAHHFDVSHVMYSVYIRMNDFVATLDPNNPIARLMARWLEGTPTLTSEEDSGMLSGYAMVARLLPFVALFAAAAFLVLRRSIRRIPPTWRRESMSALLVLFVALLFPAAVPYWGSPLYWFVLGIGLMPLAWKRTRSAAGEPVPAVRGRA